MRIVVALGGNALLKRGEPLTEQNQRENVKVAARALAPLAREHSLIITHGNGPQVGLLALEAAAYTGVEPYTLDVLSAESEGMIGYMIEQELGNILPEEVPFATILTQVEVDPADPGLPEPHQAHRPSVSPGGGGAPGPGARVDRGSGQRHVPQAGALAAAEADLRDPGGGVAGGAGRGGDLHRRGRHPHHADPRRRAGGGGGGHRQGPRRGAAGRVPGGRGLPHAHRRRGGLGGLGQPRRRAPSAGRRPDALEKLSFAAGSMGPKVEAACDFARATGGRAGIGALEDAVAIIEGRAGRWCRRSSTGLEYWPSLFHQ